MDELLFSKKYYVRKLQKNDIDQIYDLCSKNYLYYQYRPPYVTRKSIESEMVTLQDNVDIKDKNRMPTRLPITEAYMPQFFSSTDTKLGIVHKLKRVLYSISLTGKLHSLIRQNCRERIMLHFHNQYNLFFFL